jgi:hypothetical protein
MVWCDHEHWSFSALTFGMRHIVIGSCHDIASILVNYFPDKLSFYNTHIDRDLSVFGSNEKRETSDDDSSSPSMLSKAGLTKFESLRRLGGQQKDSLPRLRGVSTANAYDSFANNPIQDYLRSVAYDAESPDVGGENLRAGFAIHWFNELGVVVSDATTLLLPAPLTGIPYEHAHSEYSFG